MSRRDRSFLRVTTIILGALIVILGQADAATVTAKSASLSDVVSAIRLAQEGDTVALPAELLVGLHLLRSPRVLR